MATRVKSKTLPAVPQSKDDCAAQIKTLGDVQRDFERQRAAMNDAIAAITAEHQPRLEALTTRLEALQTGIQAWCEAHREELCAKGLKTAQFVTGEVAWRIRPPSVKVRGEEAVIETLKRLGLARFVRTAEAVNKEAILNELDAARGVAGITIVTGVEDFAITPFEARAEVAA
ncbi:MAG TPA: host-nuclease inhibitor Gam family protein [Burkholderiaceae bacterium]|nr:host-nuclease inhibitor Gam family protein [Burkholderiaceae bacterium]